MNEQKQIEVWKVGFKKECGFVRWSGPGWPSCLYSISQFSAPYIGEPPSVADQNYFLREPMLQLYIPIYYKELIYKKTYL